MNHVACFILPCMLCTTDLKNISAYCKTLLTGAQMTNQQVRTSQFHCFMVSALHPMSCVSLRPSIMCVWTCWSSFNSSNTVCDAVVTQYMQLNHHHWWHTCSEIMILFSFNVLVLALSLSHGPYCRFWSMFGTSVILCWLIQLHVSFNVQN